MKSKDLKKRFAEQIVTAMQNGNVEEVQQAITAFADDVQNTIAEDFKAYQSVTDSNILASRNVRSLTSVEQTFYEKTIDAMKNGNPKQALTDIEVAMPVTVMERVFEDIREAHPLLDLIDFRNTCGKIKMIINKTGVQLAVWGNLTDSIKKEIEGGLGEIDTGLYKLTAYLPVAKSMLDLGPQWLDRYIREVLSEAIAASSEYAIVDGDGKTSPIGMTRDTSATAAVIDGVYPRKEAIVIEDLKPKTFGNLIARLVKLPNGKTRAVPEVTLITNPVDYFTKIMPLTTVQDANGNYVPDRFPYPTKRVEAPGCPTGFAILGIPKRYFYGLGSPKNGKITYDDSVQYLEDNRVYAVHLYGNGLPKDEYSFILLDISKLGLVPLTVKSTAGTTSGNTKLNVTPATENGNSLVYKTAATVEMPEAGEILTDWTEWNGTDEVTATTGDEIAVAEINAVGTVLKTGKTKVKAKA